MVIELTKILQKKSPKTIEELKQNYQNVIYTAGISFSVVICGRDL